MGAYPHIPDDLTLCQFILDSEHPLRPARNGIPWFIEDTTGRRVGFEEVSYASLSLVTILLSFASRDVM